MRLVAIAILASAMLLFGCDGFSDDNLDCTGKCDGAGDGPSLYRAGNRFAGWGGANDRDPYLDQVQPILAKRCVTCHCCSTSPCQLKLTTYEGVRRGANKTDPLADTLFDSSIGPTRLKDGVTDDDWKAKGFFSVTEGGKDSIMYKLLEHGNVNNRDGFDLTSAYKLYAGNAEELSFQCVQTDDELDARLAQPSTGMPFGFSALPEAEYKTLALWLERGAKGPSDEARAILERPRDPAAVQAWEDFFNRPSPKERLVARYLYEHLFFARIHIDDSTAGRGDFFELVRSSTKTGPIREIVTEVPSDDPKAPFFYRLKKHTQIITEKDSVVFSLTAKVRDRWQQLFFTNDWNVTTLPGYASLNPFVYFEAIPGKARAQFMIESSWHLIEAMVKGDVCNGSSATYAIRDRFLVLFLRPDSDPSAVDPKLGQTSWSHLDPTTSSSVAEFAFESAFEAKLRQLRPQGLAISDLWDGGKTDANAWITVFRHGKSANAHQGPMGQFPETMWVLDYANFERLYYNLVVLFRPWESIDHKIGTWSRMSYARAHGEDLFLMFFPEALRDSLRGQFTPGWASWTESPMRGVGYPSQTTGLDATRPLEDFVSRARSYLGEAIVKTDSLNPDPMKPYAGAPTTITSQDELEAALFSLTINRGGYSDALPDLTWVAVDTPRGELHYTLIANRIYWSNSRLIGSFFPSINRRPELDSISVVRGHVGSFPELFLRVPLDGARAAIEAGRGSGADRLAVRKRYEIRRNSPEFWRFLENEHTRALREKPLTSGIIDTSEYLWPIELQPPKEPLQ